MKIDNRQQFLIRLTLAAAILYVGVNFILTPLAGWWTDRAKQVRELRAEVTEGQRLIARETGIRNHWADMQKNSLPASTSQAEQQLLRAVDAWSQSSGAEVTSLMPQWKNDETNYLTLACRVETSGDINALTKFLYELEKGPMALKLDSVELGARDKEGQQLTLSTEINGLALIPQNKP